MMTRFCVLRLANKTRIEWTTQLQGAHQKAKLRISIARAEGEIHRHLMCLYGDDEKLIRVVGALSALIFSRELAHELVHGM